MRQHLIPSIVASLVALAGVAVAPHVGLAPKERVVVQTAPAGSISPAKAARLAKTVWPELSQAQIDDFTARLKKIGPVPVTMFCFDDAKCGDLAGNLENAFETAHWQVLVRPTTMAPAGIRTSSKELRFALVSTTDLKVDIDDAPNAGPGEYIVIGARP